MELFAINEVVTQMEADLAIAKDGARLTLLLALSWHLRQRDTRRAVILADEVQGLLANAALPEHERQNMALRLMLIRGEDKLLFGDLEGSKALAKNALQGFDVLNDAHGCADAQLLLVWVELELGNMMQVHVALEGMVAVIGSNDEVRFILAQVGLARFAASFDVVAAKECWGAHFTALAARRAQLHPAATCLVEDYLAVIAAQCGDHVQSIRHRSKTYTLALATGQRKRAILAATHIGDSFNQLNAYNTALEWMERGLELARQSGWPSMIGFALAQTAETLRCLKRFDPASVMLHEGLTMMAATTASRDYAIALQHLADVELDRKRYTSALGCFQLLEKRAIALNQTRQLSRSLRGQAEALFQLGQPQAGLLAAQAALRSEKSDAVGQIAAFQIIANIHANHPLPTPPDMAAASTSLYYLQQALNLANSIEDYIVPGSLLDAVAEEHAKLGDYIQAFQTGKQAAIAREKIQCREAINRGKAIQVGQQTRQAEAEAAHQRELTSEAKRAEILQKNSDTLEHLGAIGQEITASLEIDRVCDGIKRHVRHLLDAEYLAIYLMNDKGVCLNRIFGLDNGEILPLLRVQLDDPALDIVRCVHERREILVEQDKVLEFNDPKMLAGVAQTFSRLFAPLCQGDKVLGAMTIQSRKHYAYRSREQMIFRTLCAYAAIAISNSIAHHNLASTYSELTATHQHLKETQAKLIQSEKMASLGGLVAGIAHEINTPLGTTLMAISGAGNALQELKIAIDDNRLSKSILDASTAQALEYTNLALRTASRAADLVTLFKTIAVQGDNDQIIKVDLAEYLPDAETLLREPLALRGCRLEIDVPAGLRLTIVHDALLEAITCVTANVFDHAFTNGRTGLLRLTARTNHNGHDGNDGNADEVIIEVEDDGHGIAPEHLPKVFDPFFTTQSGIGGHIGLGLYVAFNHITQRLKGDIRIASTLGKGTTVTILLKTNALANNTT